MTNKKANELIETTDHVIIEVDGKTFGANFVARHGKKVYTADGASYTTKDVKVIG